MTPPVEERLVAVVAELRELGAQKLPRRIEEAVRSGDAEVELRQARSWIAGTKADEADRATVRDALGLLWAAYSSES